MWIETDNYIGPCRRGGRKLRLLDRRHASETERDPSLPSLIRQLRANAQNLSDASQRRRFKLRLAATIALARRVQQNAAALQLQKLDGALDERVLADRRAVDLIEKMLQAASASLPDR